MNGLLGVSGKLRRRCRTFADTSTFDHTPPDATLPRGPIVPEAHRPALTRAGRAGAEVAEHREHPPVAHIARVQAQLGEY